MAGVNKALLNVLGKKGGGKGEKIGLGTILNGGMTLGFGVSGFTTAREEGNGVIGSVAKGVSEAILADVIGLPAYLAFSAITGAPKAAVNAVEGLGKIGRSVASAGGNAPFQNATFIDSPQAYTMRQASLNLAKMSKNNIQSAMLGNEAQYFK